MRKRIAVSGGFDPLHVGHLRLLKEAAALGEVTVILNSDAWLARKKGYSFQRWRERATILRACEYVDSVVPVDDTDGTVCHTLRVLQPDAFCNGGDRGEDNTPEKAVCDELHITCLYGIGGEKAASSSEIVARAGLPRVFRAWGWYQVLSEAPGYKVKLLCLYPNKATSEQWHHHRAEYWQVLSGGVIAYREPDIFHLGPGDDLFIRKKAVHRLTNADHAAAYVLEIQRGVRCEEDDIVRLGDD
jgi:D-beta-D-heptose 7-phosphate kinase/D-beta-D-heptose 1-phosphate adenosyltransferase